ANKILAYGVASVSGSILAVCSCTVLPLFAGIYKMGAGLGPAVAFLYAGPAINILSIILTARILGIELGIARAVGAVFFSIIIGIIMNFIFRKEEAEKAADMADMPEEEPERKLWQNCLYFFSLAGVLVFANWGTPAENSGIWYSIYSSKWLITALFAALLGIILILWFKVKWWKIVICAGTVAAAALAFPDNHLIIFSIGIIVFSAFISSGKDKGSEWFSSSWDFAKQILPLLLFGVLVAGALLGRVGHEGLIPARWIERAVGGNSLQANFFASFAGAFMYFATLTEVPILQGLIGNGMGKGPALALLLAGPALSLPNMLVIRSVIGNKKTCVFVALVIIMATISGVIFGYMIS
ncbi:MAG: permease, partial [Planctomycetota bacterium]